jgi:hypothetical protein
MGKEGRNFGTSNANLRMVLGSRIEMRLPNNSIESPRSIRATARVRIPSPDVLGLMYASFKRLPRYVRNRL